MPLYSGRGCASVSCRASHSTFRPALTTGAGPGVGRRSSRKLCQASADGALVQYKQAHSRRHVAAAGLSAFLLAQQSAHADECTLTTASNGIRFCDTKLGTGSAPSKGQLIRCHYTGRLASNNAVFDSSYERRRPLSFKVGNREVIAGWDAGILGVDDIPAMKEGGKRRLIIPPNLGYGTRGAGGLIPPNAALIFDVELLGKR